MPDPDTDIDKAKVISVTLNPAARRVIEKLREDTGVPNTEAMARILEWFAALDRKLRLAILTRDVETRTELTRLALEQMAALEPGEEAEVAIAGTTTEQAVRLIRRFADKIEENERARRLHETSRPGGPVGADAKGKKGGK